MHSFKVDLRRVGEDQNEGERYAMESSVDIVDWIYKVEKVFEKNIDTEYILGWERWGGGEKSSEDHALGKTSLEAQFSHLLR